ncbi:MAG: aminoacetone oxidase family FAD-binding enzyme, partial [Patescibacteria group bacterium]
MKQKHYDVIVIGGGPAGMMAAGRAAECGASVLLLEKNDSLGKKLLITGGGRSNITNAEFDQHLFLAKFNNATKFLFSPLSRFGVQDTISFFKTLGMPTKVEAEKRVFPASDSAQSVWDALVKYMQQGQVTVMSHMEVTGFESTASAITGVRIKNMEVYQGSAYILATGGKSRPETGSTGDGFKWLKAIGHKVNNSRPALVPLRVREGWVKGLSGLSFTDVKLSFFHQGQKQESRRGKLLFTHFGLSGPLVLNMSKSISEFLQYGEVIVSIDILPGTNAGECDKQIQGIFEGAKNKQVKNVLDSLVPPLLVPALLDLANIDPNKQVNSITRDERLRLVESIKNLQMTVTGLMGVDKAVVTSGGIALEEVDFRTMQSRLYPNLYVVGDILNIDRPSG